MTGKLACASATLRLSQVGLRVTTWRPAAAEGPWGHHLVARGHIWTCGASLGGLWQLSMSFYPSCPLKLPREFNSLPEDQKRLVCLPAKHAVLWLFRNLVIMIGVCLIFQPTKYAAAFILILPKLPCLEFQACQDCCEKLMLVL